MAKLISIYVTEYNNIVHFYLFKAPISPMVDFNSPTHKKYKQKQTNKNKQNSSISQIIMINRIFLWFSLKSLTVV